MKWKVEITLDNGEDGIETNIRQGNDDLHWLLLDCLEGLECQPIVHVLGMLSRQLEWDGLDDEEVGDMAYDFLKVCHKKLSPAVRLAIDNISYED